VGIGTRRGGEDAAAVGNDTLGENLSWCRRLVVSGLNELAFEHHPGRETFTQLSRNSPDKGSTYCLDTDIIRPDGLKLQLSCEPKGQQSL
jgi:hypothetical protein